MSDYDGVGIGDLMTVEECAEEIGRLDAKLKALEAENKALLEAAQAVVETDADARRQQVTHWKNPTIDALAALLEGNEDG